MDTKEAERLLEGHPNREAILKVLREGENQWPYNRREIPCAPNAIQAIETKRRRRV